MKFVRIIETTFTEVEDGDYVDPDTSEEDIELDEGDEDSSLAEQAAGVLRDHGCTQSSGSGWYSDPDGSYISDYRTGERTETSGHLHGLSEDEENAVHALMAASKTA